MRNVAMGGERLTEARLLLSASVVIGVLVAATFASVIAPYSPVAFDVARRLSGPTPQHLLGTDQFGRDLLSRLLYGARASSLVAFASMSMAGAVGSMLGLVSGYTEGFAELALMRIVDLILSFPAMIIALLVVTVFGPGIVTLTFVIAFLFAPVFARVMYGQVVSLRRLEYVEAARAIGSPPLRIMIRTILPNALAALIVQFSLGLASAILLESGLSFLGLGVVPPTPSWGLMISDARSTMTQAPQELVWPCLAIILTILAMNTLGDIARDRMDPTLRRSAPIAGATRR